MSKSKPEPVNVWATQVRIPSSEVLLDGELSLPRGARGAETKVTHLVGEVRGRPCLIVDDMISTGGTIAEAHGSLPAGARDKPSREGAREVLVTDTVPVKGQGRPRL